MTIRNSIRATLHFEDPPQICQFEWGYWPETLERWRQEGLRGDPWDAAGITFYHRAPVKARFCPAFAAEVLSETATSRVVRDGSAGLICL